jgi:hypothetical protein
MVLVLRVRYAIKRMSRGFARIVITVPDFHQCGHHAFAIPAQRSLAHIGIIFGGGGFLAPPFGLRMMLFAPSILASFAGALAITRPAFIAPYTSLAAGWVKFRVAVLDS